MTAALKTASEDFLRELSVVEATLDRLARKLEEEFAERYKGSAVNPMALAKRVQKLQRGLPDLKADCQSLIQRKQELIDAAKHQLINNHERIQHLSSSSGLPQDGETEETYTEFTQAIAEWDASQVATGTSGLPQYNRDELNRALAGSLVAQ